MPHLDCAKAARCGRSDHRNRADRDGICRRRFNEGLLAHSRASQIRLPGRAARRRDSNSISKRRKVGPDHEYQKAGDQSHNHQNGAEKDIKNKETKKQLNKGNFFQTTEGTIIVYIGNNHRWFHMPKKLYDLFVKLKGQEVVIVGGSDNECLEDVIIAGDSLGVMMKRDHRYIWSPSNCPKF